MTVKTHRHAVYPLVYLLVELALVLPVVIAIVERVFSAIKTIQSLLFNSNAIELMSFIFHVVV